MEAHSAMGAMGWRYREDDEIFELVVYATPGCWLPEPYAEIAGIMKMHRASE
jgi:hypothetical protein